jgi:hypothetical protein
MRDWILRILFPSPPPPPPSKPYVIPDSPNQVPTGPNLVPNGSFELPAVNIGTQQVVTGSGVIQNWLVLQNGGQARWITSDHAVFSQAALGTRFVDLTGGTPAGPGRVLATIYQDYPLGLQSGQSYEISVELGVGPNNGPFANFGPPVSVWVRVIRPPDSVERQFVSNPLNPPTGTGVTWERVSFRFAIPATFVLPPASQTIAIWGQAGYDFIGVDNVSLRLLT